MTRAGPTFALERALGGLVCGVDEAGRGPLAGPVVAAAVILDPARLPEGLDDSKRLSAGRRERLLVALLDCATCAVGTASVAEIDRLNILWATMLAMRRAVERLDVRPDAALIDGNRAPDLACAATPVIGGDGLCLSVAAASIVAKVTRDRMMALLAARYPGYGWERNAGYGTADHRAALARLGATAHHRASFAPVRAALVARGLAMGGD